MSAGTSSNLREPVALTPVDLTVATLAAVNASGNSGDLVNPAGANLVLVANITAITGTSPTITFTIQGKDAASGVYRTILTGAAITAVGTQTLKVSPHLTAAANVVAQDLLPATWRVSWAIGGTTPSVSGTIGAAIIP